MADWQSSARVRAAAGAPTSGVIHVRTRLTTDFTVISNALAQRRCSAVTVGVAVYISSLPEGSPVTIAALCAHFTEGEILISRALRELEAAGYLERRRERLPNGRIRTRTYFYAVPGADGSTDPDPDGPPPPEPPAPRRARERPATAPAATAIVTEPAPPVALADADPEAVAVLSALQRVDPRLSLSVREAARLAPAVSEWLAAGLGRVQIVKVLTEGLPDHLLTRPAGILAYRLRDVPLAAPPLAPTPAHGDAHHAVLPFQTCDGCDKAFRAPQPGHCRHCRQRSRPHAAA